LRENNAVLLPLSPARTLDCQTPAADLLHFRPRFARHPAEWIEVSRRNPKSPLREFDRDDYSCDPAASQGDRSVLRRRVDQ
jgi:hypothetical protein